MVLGYHKNDFLALPNEKQVMDDLRKHNLPKEIIAFQERIV